jgi:hypothetical protein
VPIVLKSGSFNLLEPSGPVKARNGIALPLPLPYIIRCSSNNQHYALICTTSLFYILAPTCFGSSLPYSGSFLDPSELPEIQIKWVVYHMMCGYVACVPDCRGSICCASQRTAYALSWEHVGAKI